MNHTLDFNSANNQQNNSERLDSEAIRSLTWQNRISVLATKGYTKFNRNLSEFSLQKVKSKYGVICVQDMMFRSQDNKCFRCYQLTLNVQALGAVFSVKNSAV